MPGGLIPQVPPPVALRRKVVLTTAGRSAGAIRKPMSAVRTLPMLLAAATALHMPRGRIATHSSLTVAAHSSPLLHSSSPLHYSSSPLLRRSPLRRSPLRMSSQPSAAEGPAASAIRRYFGAWNKRDMVTAVAQFAEDCEYDDTQYSDAFSGKTALEAHLNKVADALPPTFQFCIDEVADAGDTCGVQWHVENDGKPLPFTRGCSMYKTDASGLIVSGFDVPEPAPLKPGSSGLLVLGLASKIIKEPVRAVPLVAWGLYCFILFFSNGILPGPDATQLDMATWVEVRDLSLNFWLIAPGLGLPFAPTVHPGLEAIFNGLLAWAAAFGGFVVDGRRGRPSGSMVPHPTPVLWMPIGLQPAPHRVAVSITHEPHAGAHRAVDAAADQRLLPAIPRHALARERRGRLSRRVRRTGGAGGRGASKLQP